eukprot:6482003-Amphidinium_carterae.3
MRSNERDRNLGRFSMLPLVVFVPLALRAFGCLSAVGVAVGRAARVVCSCRWHSRALAVPLAVCVLFGVAVGHVARVVFVPLALGAVGRGVYGREVSVFLCARCGVFEFSRGAKMCLQQHRWRVGLGPGLDSA